MVTVRRGADIEEREIERKKKEEAIFSLLIESGFSFFLLPVTMVLRKEAILCIDTEELAQSMIFNFHELKS